MQNVIEELRALLSKHEARIAKLEAAIATRPTQQHQPARTKEFSVKEFLRSKKPKTDMQKTLAVGYYLEKYVRVSSFNVQDLEEAFRAAKEPLPSNTHAFVGQNIKNGHMMESKEKKDKKKAYVLTNSGEEFVENDFNRRQKE